MAESTLNHSEMLTFIKRECKKHAHIGQGYLSALAQEDSAKTASDHFEGLVRFVDRQCDELGPPARPNVCGPVSPSDRFCEADTVCSSIKSLCPAKLQCIFDELCDPRTEVVASALTTLRGLKRRNHESFFGCLRHIAGREFQATHQATILRETRRHIAHAGILAFCGFEESVSPQEAITWLEQPTTTMYDLAQGPARHILVAEVASGDKRFTAAWLKAEPQRHILLVNGGLTADDRLGKVWHEIDVHGIDRLCSLKSTGEEIQMPEHEQVSFVQSQMRIDPDEKTVLSRWAVDDLPHPLRDGDGVFLDAGSSCLDVWRVIGDRLRASQFRHLTVYTSNFMILQDWTSENRSIPRSQAKVNLAGSVFDDEHLAFYGEAVRDVLMSGRFRPSVVYVGTSGIEFDDKAGILFGYHAGDPEYEVKQCYFQCPAKQRIILATPRKIGVAGGLAFNVLKVSELDTRAPIYLVTTEPEPDSEEERQFEKAKEVFEGENIQRAIRESGVKFHWITLKRDHPTPIEDLAAPLVAEAKS